MSLKIEQLTKTYANGVKAIDNLSIEIQPGMFGLLGPNGAGKSSLMRTIATLQTPDKGSIRFNEIDVLTHAMEVRKRLGYLPQSFGVYPKVSAEKLLHYFARLKGVTSKRERSLLVGEVLELTNLTHVRKKSVSGYSGGMKQRFGIAQLLLNNPPLIIVDEPTAGLDPAERNRFLNVLREIGARNTVIFSTHLVDDVKELCNEMAIMNHGRILMKANPSEAIRQLEGKIWIRNIEKDALESMERRYHVLSSGYNEDHSLNIRVYADARPDTNFQPTEANLEDVYFTVLDGFNVFDS
ncbi:MAG: ABC transporter ATP-binding protein [Bacteroidota bacterium]